MKLLETKSNGTEIWIDEDCPRCGGTGTIPQYNRVDGGRCWECGGNGKRKEAKIYRVSLASRTMTQLEKEHRSALCAYAGFAEKYGQPAVRSKFSADELIKLDELEIAYKKAHEALFSVKRANTKKR